MPQVHSYIDIPADNSPSSKALHECLDFILTKEHDKAYSMLENKEVDIKKHGNRILTVSCFAQNVKLVNYLLSFDFIDPSYGSYHAFRVSISSHLSTPHSGADKILDSLFSKLGPRSENAKMLPVAAIHKRYFLIKNILSFCPKNKDVDMYIVETAPHTNLSNDCNSTSLLVSHISDIKKVLSDINSVYDSLPPDMIKFSNECKSFMACEDKKSLKSNITPSPSGGKARKLKKI